MLFYLPAVLRLRRKHGRCDSDNLSLPSTDDEAVNNGERKMKNINTNYSSSSEGDEDSEDSVEPYNMGTFPVETRTCVICHRVGCKDEHIKRKPKTVFTNPEEILEGAYIFFEEVYDVVGGGDGTQILSAEKESTEDQAIAIGDSDVYKEKLLELKEQLDNEYADEEEEANYFDEKVSMLEKDIEKLSDSQSQENERGDAISIPSDSSVEEYALEQMNNALPEVFSQIDQLYKDVVNEEAILNVKPSKTLQWDDYMEGSLLSQILSQWNFGVDFMESNMEDYLEDSLILIELSQWNFEVVKGKKDIWTILLLSVWAEN